MMGKRQRLVHLDDASQVERVGHLLELGERQFHERVAPAISFGVEFQRALELFDGLRVHGKTACCHPPPGWAALVCLLLSNYRSPWVQQG